MQDAALVRLSIDQICSYDADPRRAENPEYSRIKASIRANGIDQPLIVTQRPGQTGYMVHSGGNTRLRALQELYRESGDARFAQVACVVRPWTQEVDVLLAHLRENDLRGPLSFIDKALAVHAANSLLNVDRDGERLDQKRLCEALSERGYAVSRALVCHMTYAVERLLPLLPQALNGGMGRPQVERIRQLERAARAQWRDRLGDEGEFHATFATLCQRYDAPDWDIAELRRALEAEIAMRAETSIHAIHLALERALHGVADPEGAPATAGKNASQGAAVPTAESLPHTDKAAIAKATPQVTSLTADAAGSDVAPAQPSPGEPDRSTPPAATMPAELDRARSAGEGSAKGAPPPEGDSPAAPPADRSHRPVDLKSLRARAWTLASRLAQRHGLGELIQPLSDRGLGFVLTDVPDPALVDQLDEDALAQVSMVWWHLAAAAEMTVAPVAPLLRALDEASVLRQALQDQDAGLLFAGVWTLDPGHMGFRLWRCLGERDWQDLLDLMANYRALHQVAEVSGQALWA
jgi:ParB family protein of integrating conjugative element (PFGI_1 class)